MSRAERLAGLLKTEISAVIQSKLHDHRIGFVSITEIKVTADLAQARVFVSCYGTEAEKKKSLRGLISAIPFIRGQLAQNIDTRIVPRLRFVLDDSLESGAQRIELLNKIAREREARVQKINPAA
ncbi:MAG: 30S ribosome-binding factor RbfA [Candidatus Margulisbacteria bacterium]|jgi:ribosome-binding factor A|nr:30S ribosome-binding factor RbfA [Candidatus Margulisiibacteriota bacterium]